MLLAIPALSRGRPSSRTLALLRDYSGPMLAALVGALTALVFIRAPGFLRPAFDDSYITLTFARNLAGHGMLSFDGQHWTSGATSPLHVVLLAALIKLGAAPIFAAMAVGVASNALLAAGVYTLGWAVFRNRLAAAAAALLIAFTGYAAADAGNGLETSLFMALVAWTMAAFLLLRSWRGRAFTGLLVAVCLLTRPEGAFLLPAFLVYHWLERPKEEPLDVFLWECVLLAAPAVAMLGVLLVLSTQVDGGFVGTANAKLHFFREYELPLQERIKRGSDDIGLFIAPVVTLIALAAIVVKKREVLLFALFWAPIMAFYVLIFPGGLFHYYYRYQHPVLPLIAVVAGGGVVYLLGVAAKNGLVVKALVVLALIVAILPLGEMYLRWRHIYTVEARENRDLQAMVSDLNRIIRPDQTLATHDIGAVGYFGRFRVLDIVGLVNPGVIPYHAGRRVRAYIDAKRPDYLLIFPEWDGQFLRIDAAYHPERYELVKVYPGGEIQIASYYLYRIRYP